MVTGTTSIVHGREAGSAYDLRTRMVILRPHERRARRPHRRRRWRTVQTGVARARSRVADRRVCSRSRRGRSGRWRRGQRRHRCRSRAHVAILGYAFALLAAGRAATCAADWLLLTIGAAPVRRAALDHRGPRRAASRRARHRLGGSALSAPIRRPRSRRVARRLAERAAAPRLRMRTTCWSRCRRSRLYLRGRRGVRLRRCSRSPSSTASASSPIPFFPVDGPRIWSARPPRRKDRSASFVLDAPRARIIARDGLSLLARRRVRGRLRCARWASAPRRRRGRRRRPRRSRVATVYGGFHYAVDALAGVMLGGLAWLVSTVALEPLASRGSQSATAA